MKKVIGYGVSIAGIVLMVVGFEIVELELAILKGALGQYVSWIGIVMIVVGVVMALDKKGVGKKKVKGGEDEIPIYEGVGKKRKVVGYRKG
ncbi:hypothetical protein HNV12_02660 [Methanococcoides sp. SA1]|nr:hypothetical protein [Methanococcoides sp. SA1]